MSNQTREPAFPVFPEGQVGHAAAFRGMSLRDWFAGQALEESMRLSVDQYGGWDPIAAAACAYDVADAMLAARATEEA